MSSPVGRPRACIASVVAMVIAWTFTTVPALAHDYWLTAEPPAPGDEETVVRMWVGQRLEPEREKPFLTDRTVSFVHVSADGRTALEVADQAQPIWRGKLGPGGHMFALERNAAFIELEAAKFEAYLEHEGLDDVVERRREAGESATLGRERYTRYLKLLVRPGEEAVYGAEVGHALEIVLRGRPVAGSPLPFELRFRGAPLPSVSIDAYAESGRHTVVHTDGDGRGRLPAPEAGSWLLRKVHMVRCEDCERADWHSYWTAFSLLVAPDAPPIADVVDSPPLDAPPTTSDGGPGEPKLATPPPSKAGCAGCATSTGSPSGTWLLVAVAIGTATARRRSRPKVETAPRWI